MSWLLIINTAWQMFAIWQTVIWCCSISQTAPHHSAEFFFIRAWELVLKRHQNQSKHGMGRNVEWLIVYVSRPGDTSCDTGWRCISSRRCPGIERSTRLRHSSPTVSSFCTAMKTLSVLHNFLTLTTSVYFWLSSTLHLLIWSCDDDDELLATGYSDLSLSLRSKRHCLWTETERIDRLCKYDGQTSRIRGGLTV